MSGATFPLLFSPLTLRSVTLPNRIVLLPMGTRLVRDGKPTDDGVAFHEARAAGGVGLIMTGGTAAHPSTTYRDGLWIEAYDPETIPALARLAARVHEHGAKIFGQVGHIGREYNRMADEAEWPASGPSPVPGSSALAPHALTTIEIDELVQGYARATANLRRAGYDGVEVQANHGYLAAQFLSPRSNRREDQYGGPLANRMRFLLGIVDAVRDLIGDEPPFGVRLTSDEEIEDGLGVADCCEIARALEATGKVDYLSLTVGLPGSYVKDMAAPAGVGASRAAAVKRATRLPVIVSQRITHPTLAEEILRSGSADLIGMARALIADPEWAKKAREGRIDEIRPCVGAVQGCHTFPLGCVHSPEAGRERVWSSASLRSRLPSGPRKVVVVGGGPAGLEAAMVAATRGHRVTLFEREPILGGQVAIAAKAPWRAELYGIVSFRQAELGRLGVDLRLGTPVTGEQVLRERPDCVIIATGAGPRRPAFDGADLPHVLTVWQLLEGREPDAALVERARSAVVIDDGSGSWEVCSSAEYLAERGLAVALVTPALAVAQGVPKESLRSLLIRLRHHGVTFHPMARVLAVEPGLVTICDNLRLEADKVIEPVDLAADVVVAHGGKQSEHSLMEALAGRVPALHAVGDCVAPRRIREATFEGHRIGRAV